VTFVVLVILAVVWAVYLASWVRSRTEHRRVNSINSFSQHLSVLERTAPGSRSSGARPTAGRTVAPSLPGVGSPSMARRTTLSQAKKRRRDVLVGLLAATGVTFLGAVVMGGTVRYLFGLSLVLTVAYVVALASIQKRSGCAVGMGRRGLDRRGVDRRGCVRLQLPRRPGLRRPRSLTEPDRPR
jgi:hypothetical protein